MTHASDDLKQLDTILGRERPAYLSRQQTVSATTSVVHNQILHEDAKPQHCEGEVTEVNRPF